MLNDADKVFANKGGEILLKQLVRHYADNETTNSIDRIKKLKFVGKQIHPNIRFYEYVPIIPQIETFKPIGGQIRDKELYGEFDMNLLPSKAFLEESIANDADYFSAKTIEWVHANYEDQKISKAPIDVWLEITDKFR
jgi:hypothetical protein